MVLVLREAEVGVPHLVARQETARDRAAPIHLPVDEGERDHVRHPDLRGGEQQPGAVGALRDELEDELTERELVADAAAA